MHLRKIYFFFKKPVLFQNFNFINTYMYPTDFIKQIQIYVEIVANT